MSKFSWGSSCQIKEQFPSRWVAEQVRRNMMSSGRIVGGLHIYPCYFGKKHYHIAHAIPKRREKRQKNWMQLLVGIEE